MAAIICYFAAVSAAAEEDNIKNFGNIAAGMLEMLDQDFPGRETGTASADACADWLEGQMNSFGYRVERQPFTMPDGAAGQNLISLKTGNSEKEILLCAHYDSDFATHGADDNGSGVSLVLETAKRLAGKSIPCSVRIIYWSGEEAGMIGSKAYVEQMTAEEQERILCVINVDSIAAGDRRYVHGGIPQEDGSVSGIWLQKLALEISEEYGLGMTTHPGIGGIPAGTRVQGSDQMFFAYRGIPYIYLEASLYSDQAGNDKPHRVQTADSRVEGGQIMHSPWDELEKIRSLFPGRTEEHLAAYSRLVYRLCTGLTPEGQLLEAVEETEAVPETASSAETASDTAAQTAPITETGLPPVQTEKEERDTATQEEGTEEQKQPIVIWLAAAAACLVFAGGAVAWASLKRRKR